MSTTDPHTTHDNALIGLTLIAQLFDDTDAGAARNAYDAYNGDFTVFTKSMLTAALLMLQQYAANTDLSIEEMAARVRADIMAGRIQIRD